MKRYLKRNAELFGEEEGNRLGRRLNTNLLLLKFQKFDRVAVDINPLNKFLDLSLSKTHGKFCELQNESRCAWNGVRVEVVFARVSNNIARTPFPAFSHNT